MAVLGGGAVSYERGTPVCASLGQARMLFLFRKTLIEGDGGAPWRCAERERARERERERKGEGEGEGEGGRATNRERGKEGKRETGVLRSFLITVSRRSRGLGITLFRSWAAVKIIIIGMFRPSIRFLCVDEGGRLHDSHGRLPSLRLAHGWGCNLHSAPFTLHPKPEPQFQCRTGHVLRRLTVVQGYLAHNKTPTPLGLP